MYSDQPPECKAIAREEIEKVIVNAKLNDAQRKSLVMKYGLFNAGRHTLAEIAKEFGFSRARAGQLVSRALEKCREAPKFTR